VSNKKEHNASFELEGPGWPDEQFWADLNRLEARHQSLQSQHELTRRELKNTTKDMAKNNGAEFREVWQRYCAVIAELDRVSGEFEALRARAG
jgi:hypothetical protein